MTDFFFYPKKTHTGGTAEATDSIDGSILKEGDAVFVVDPTTRKLDVLTLDEDSAAAEDSPRVIKPDSNAGDKRFVKVKTHDGIHEYLSFYTNFEAAIAGIGSSVKTLVVDTLSSIILDCTVPATLTLEVRRGCALAVASAKTLAINGKFICGPYQAFDGTGTVTFAVNAVTEIYPEWWGTFPNGSNDTAILNKALAAAILVGSTAAWDNATVIVRPGIYYVTAGAVRTIETSLYAPHAKFIVTAQPTNQTDIIFNITDSGYNLNITIGQISGVVADILADQNHYGVGVYTPRLYQGKIRIGSLLGLYMGLFLDSQTSQYHIAENLIEINAIVGCDYAVTLHSGSNADTQCEANRIYVNYVTYCANAVDCKAYANDLVSNVIEIQVLELSARANSNGFSISGDDCMCNTFRVTGFMIPPTGTGVIARCIVDGTYGAPIDNVFELCYLDFSKINVDTAAYNIFRGEGVANSRPGDASLDLSRSSLMLSAAPTTNAWRDGDKVWNNSPSDGTLGWVNTADGVPGTWRKMGVIYLESSEVWNPGSIAAGSYEQEDITVTGAALGDFAIASFSIATGLLRLDAQVIATNVVSVQLFNPTTGAIDLAEGTMYVRVFKR